MYALVHNFLAGAELGIGRLLPVLFVCAAYFLGRRSVLSGWRALLSAAGICTVIAIVSAGTVRQHYEDDGSGEPGTGGWVLNEDGVRATLAEQEQKLGEIFTLLFAPAALGVLGRKRSEHAPSAKRSPVPAHQ